LISAGALLQTPQGELTALPDPQLYLSGRISTGRDGKREGRESERERGRKGEGREEKGREECLCPQLGSLDPPVEEDWCMGCS